MLKQKRTPGAPPPNQTNRQPRSDTLSEQQDSGALSLHLAPMLDALRGDRQRAGYYLRLLTPLHRYDTDHHGDLVKTLATYLRNAGNGTRTADALYLHRNSLRYRLARIRALTGLDIDEPDTRLALHIAVLLAAESEAAADATRHDQAGQ